MGGYKALTFKGDGPIEVTWARADTVGTPEALARIREAQSKLNAMDFSVPAYFAKQGKAGGK